MPTTQVLKYLYVLATSLLGLAAVYVLSTTRFVFRGPRVESWDYKTHVMRDFMAFVMRKSASDDDHIFANLVFGDRDPTKPVLKLRGGYAIKFTVPAYPLEEALLANAGIWRDKLHAVARESSNMQMRAECVLSDAMISSNKETDIGTIHKTPPNGSEKIILHFHGGAYVAGTLEQYRRLHLMLSRNTGMRVYGFAYRLAPQSQFPTQLYDAYCALQHLREIGYKDRDIVLSGDSAGGNLVMALWQLTRAQLGALILLSPRVDVTSKRESWKQNASVDILPQYNLFDPGCSTRKLLAPEGPVTQELLQLLEDPFVSPIHADLKKMPRTLIQVGTAEVMYDDIREFARRATEQSDTGASIDLQVFRDGFHVFQAVPFVMNAERAWDAIGAFARSIQ